MKKNKIRLLRIWKGYTQQEMARLLRVNVDLYQKIENKIQKADSATLKEIEKVFDLRKGSLE